MSEERWIVIPRWDDFQHADAARSRTLPWIKSWTRLLSDNAYLDLTGHQRAILHGIWLEYARSHCQLTLSTVSLTRRLGLRVTTQHLEALNHAGFIHFSASKPASKPASSIARTEERRVEEPLGSSTTHVTGARATPANAGRASANGKRPAIDIATDRVRNVGAELPLSDLTAELRDALDQRYNELTSDQLVELRDLHAALAAGATA
jgi:hypothetical protein